ncbi:hypothetical protein CK203_114183 [Vitis vinifera]|uniref:Uncharacterized protein n=1 Tax=Vitis vinifera TaxID=29760 RepID=A0A438D7E4_VITVI|nr:hypothetical protein CK203_114183 [Vitis vinifera]
MVSLAIGGRGFQMAEHACLTARADEERKNNPNYKPILEHDGLLWQRSRNQHLTIHNFWGMSMNLKTSSIRPLFSIQIGELQYTYFLKEVVGFSIYLINLKLVCKESSKTRTREELLAEERDYKRRRMSYRGKKLKQTTTEVGSSFDNEISFVLNKFFSWLEIISPTGSS